MLLDSFQLHNHQLRLGVIAPRFFFRARSKKICVRTAAPCSPPGMTTRPKRPMPSLAGTSRPGGPWQPSLCGPAPASARSASAWTTVRSSSCWAIHREARSGLTTPRQDWKRYPLHSHRGPVSERGGQPRRPNARLGRRRPRGPPPGPGPLAARRAVASRPALEGHTLEVRSVAFSPEGTLSPPAAPTDCSSCGTRPAATSSTT